MKDFKKLEKILPLNTSGLQNSFREIKILKKNKYIIQKNYTITGAAPKEFVRIYEYKKGVHKASNINKWDLYIVKSAKKWYSTECIIEQLNTDIGKTLGLNMANTRLIVINNQLRLCSKYFLSNNEELLHGADLFAGYLQSRELIDEIEKNKLEKSFFNVSYVFEVINYTFPGYVESLFDSFLKMLVLDAFIGV
jgi:hypothetical protein